MNKLLKHMLFFFALLFQLTQAQAATYLIKFTCDYEASKIFAHMTDEQIESEIPKGVTKLARYHDVANKSGVALFETEDVNLLQQFLYSWAEVCEIHVSPVLNDEEARKIFKGL